MNKEQLREVFSHYGIDQKEILELLPLGNGLIHSTYQAILADKKLVLQAYNEKVFPFPDRIASNLGILSTHGVEKSLSFQLPLPLTNQLDSRLTLFENQLFRIFPFVPGRTLETVENPNQAFLAAKSFGALSSACAELSVEQFQETIPNFHRLDLRFETLKEVSNGKQGISGEEQEILSFYLNQQPLIDWYLGQVDQLPLRVTHNDTKINNLIFSENLQKVQALIDLDTLMAGYLMYDFGDLVRTVSCTQSETSIAWEEIGFSPDIFETLLRGYWEGVNAIATPQEIRSLLFGGEIMTLIMGLRFLTDHLQGNIYYRVSYPEQNFHRAKNQMIFLQRQQENREMLKDSWEKVTKLKY